MFINSIFLVDMYHLYFSLFTISKPNIKHFHLQYFIFSLVESRISNGIVQVQKKCQFGKTACLMPLILTIKIDLLYDLLNLLYNTFLRTLPTFFSATDLTEQTRGSWGYTKVIYSKYYKQLAYVLAHNLGFGIMINYGLNPGLFSHSSIFFGWKSASTWLEKIKIII